MKTIVELGAKCPHCGIFFVHMEGAFDNCYYLYYCSQCKCSYVGYPHEPITEEDRNWSLISDFDPINNNPIDCLYFGRRGAERLPRTTAAYKEMIEGWVIMNDDENVIVEEIVNAGVSSLMLYHEDIDGVPVIQESREHLVECLLNIYTGKIRDL